MGASKAIQRGLNARLERLRVLQPPIVIAVKGRFLKPGSHEYEKELKALAESLSGEEFENMLHARKPPV
jgi:hypothetical protein